MAKRGSPKRRRSAAKTPPRGPLQKLRPQPKQKPANTKSRTRRAQKSPHSSLVPPPKPAQARTRKLPSIISQRPPGAPPTPTATRPSRLIIGKYARVQVDAGRYPWRMICYLEMVFPTRDDIIGTGTLIGSDNTPRAVVTAGHNLYDPRYGGPALRVTITAGNASPLPFSPAGWTVNPRHIADPDAAAFDYAVITLPADHPFKRFGYMALNDYAGDLRGVPVCLSGYPEDQPAGTQWKAEGPIYYSTDRLIYHRLDTLGGQSGSPIFYAYGQDDTGNSLYSLLGIHGGYDGDLNRGVRTTPDVVNDLLQWSGMA